MFINVEFSRGAPPTIEITGDLGSAGSVYQVCDEVSKLRHAGHRIVCIDLSSSRGEGFASAFNLIEIATREASSILIPFAVPKKTLKALDRCEVRHLLTIAPDKDAALRVAATHPSELVDTSAVVLCAGYGTRMGLLSQVTPKPMLDILGQPAVSRIVDHLATSGVCQINLNPGHLGHQIPQFFEQSDGYQTRLSYFPEGEWRDGLWHAEPIGSASTLLKMHHHYRALSGDVIVICGDALTNIDLRDMLHRHRTSGAGVTIAAMTVADHLVSRYGIMVPDEKNFVRSFQEKPRRSEAKSNLANVGIYIISADILSDIEMRLGLDIATDLLPEVMSKGHPIAVYREDFEWLDIGCGQDYAEVLSDLLSRHRPWLVPDGTEVSAGLWLHKGAQVEKKTSFAGPAYVGKDTFIHKKAHISGPSVIGSNCRVDRLAQLNKCILLDGTEVHPSASLDGVIASDHWVIEHSNAAKTQISAEYANGRASTHQNTSVPLLQAS